MSFNFNCWVEVLMNLLSTFVANGRQEVLGFFVCLFV